MFSEKVNAVFEDQDFTEKLATLESEEDIVAAFAEKGLDYEKDFAAVLEESNPPEGELDDETLEFVSGGGKLKLFVSAAVGGWKAGVLIRRAYDYVRYGDPYKTYAKGSWI